MITFEELMKGFDEIRGIMKEVWLKSEENEMMIKELREQSKDTDRIVKELAQESRKTEKIVAQTSKAVNDLTGKWGRFVEGLVVPAAKRIFNERGIELEHTHQRSKSEVEGAEMEIDVLATNGEYAVAIEVKSTLTVKHIKEHIEKLKKFKRAFPVYRDKKIIGAAAGIVIEGGVDRYAYQRGLFVIAQSGDTVKILNDAKFNPTYF
ncbi:Resolvase, Holliday junction-type [Candidatus Magnetoovum chiemensis]|nr:Resolvase, Holliday junction-type [Candidatus Magnetoovum chiemensis]